MPTPLRIRRITMTLGLPFAVLALMMPGHPAEGAAQPAANPRVVLHTTKGDLTIELFADKAPQTVENFLAYVRSGHFDGTVFHRVIPGFVIQGGGFTAEMRQKPTSPPIQNEAKNGVKNARGTLSMARTSDPHSATSQFFVNLVDNRNLDDPGEGGWGYAVFGKVVEGMGVVDSIAKEPTGNRAGHQNVPINPVTVTKAEVAP
jgi:cyclophilin family peptidyl-prolyl cis-trans isomerase